MTRGRPNALTVAIMRQTIADLFHRNSGRGTPPDDDASVARLRRTTVYTRSTDASYGVHVSDGDDTPNDWARFLRDITSRPGGSVAKLARDADIHRSTIFRWLRGDIRNITLDSVRRIARAAQVDYSVALQAARSLMETSNESDDDLTIRMIRESKLATPIKEELIEHVRQQRLQDRERLRREVEMMLRAAGE